MLLLLGAWTVSAQEATPAPLPTETATPVPISALLGLSVEPPMDITLPDGWQRVLLDTYIYHDIMADNNGGQLATVPIAVYRGPVTGGTGWIVVLWAYDSIVPIDTSSEDFTDRALWLDALRLLQFVIFDIRCNIGTAPQRDYTIGEYPAIGTTFSAVDCPLGAPDTRGWFATLEVDGLNFVFYNYIDPLPPKGSQAEYDIQAILDTVQFHVDDMLLSRADFEATRQAYLSQSYELTPEATAELTAEASPEATEAASN